MLLALGIIMQLAAAPPTRDSAFAVRTLPSADLEPPRWSLEVFKPSVCVFVSQQKLLDGGRILVLQNDLQHQAILPKRFAFACGVPMGKLSRHVDESSRLSCLGLDAYTCLLKLMYSLNCLPLFGIICI
jgi:hypothetical protein